MPRSGFEPTHILPLVHAVSRCDNLSRQAGDRVDERAVTCPECLVTQANCRHPEDEREGGEGLTNQGWNVGVRCNACGQTLSSRDAGRSLDGPDGGRIS